MLTSFSFLLSILNLHLTLLSIISKSSIEMCSNKLTTNPNSTLSDPQLNCTTKLVIALSVENAKMEDTDYIDAYVTETTTSTGEIRQLVNPYKITISKTAVTADYPATYLQDFNFKPREQIIFSDVFSCQDGDLAKSPTCAWAYDTKGKVIANSQGFCCKCDFSQIVGIDTTSSSRGSICDFMNLGTGSATAHCLKFDELWYSAYEIKTYQISYQIAISITHKNNLNSTDSNSSQYSVEDIQLSPSNVIGISQSSIAIARLIGDFQPSIAPNDYSAFYLLTPSSPETHSMVQEGPLNWMLVRSDQFSLDGRSCDKIGVGYYAFRTQGGDSKCQMKIGDCLHNQIYDYYMSDLQLITEGKSPKYLLSQDRSREYSFFSYSPTTKKFSYKLNGLFNTLITLEIKADDIKYVVNVSSGTIDYVTILTFESQTSDGMMELQITNSGNLSANYFLSYNCSEYILPITALQVSLAPFRSQVIKNVIYTLSQDARTHSCDIVFKNSIGEIVDNKTQQFNTTKTIINNNQNFNNSSSNNENNTEEEQSNQTDEFIQLDCKILCPGFFDFLCFVAHGCWGYFARTLGILLLIVVVIIFVIKFIKNGGFCRCIDKIVSCVSGKKTKSNVKTKGYDI